MKVGILTFQFAHNHGAVLQAYALKKHIQKLGFEVKIINYHHETIPDLYPKENNEKRWEKFNKFINELIDYEEQVYTKEEELEKLDIDYWISGSDQVWSPELTMGMNKGYFLNFETNGKKISYAASMGKNELPKEYEEEFKNYINQIDVISVREEILKQYAEKFTDKKVERVLDPTVLLEEQDYNELVLDNTNGEYVLIYELIPDERMTEVAKRIAQEKNVKIIELNDKKKENYFCEQISEASPYEFLTLMKNAKAVITNSFHGTIFSIIFKKEFYTISRLNRNARTENILKIVGMEDRLIHEVEQIKKVKGQDFDVAFERLNEHKENSKMFLKKALELE